jgi:hypothetical protein
MTAIASNTPTAISSNLRRGRCASFLADGDSAGA